MSFVVESPSMEAAFPSTGRKRNRPRSMEISEISQTPRTIRTITRVPLRRKTPRSEKIYPFKRTYDLGALFLTTDGINPTYSAWNFSMNDMPGYTELTSLFDFYKLTGVLVRVMPYKQTDSNSVSSTNNSFNPPIFYAVDHSDSTAPTTVGEILEYDDHKIANVFTGFKIFIRPKFADATSAQRGGWVATSNPSQNWYGLKIAIPAAGAATAFYVTWTYYVKCKQPK